MHTCIKLCILLVTVLLLAACRPIMNTPTSQQDETAEAVGIATANVDEAVPTSPPAQPITDTAGSQTPAPTEGKVSDQDMAIYEGRSPYGDEFPRFTVSYDPGVWQLVTRDEENILQHKELPSCEVRLAAGAYGAFATEKVTLGDYSWDVAEVNPDIFHYGIPYETIAYMFDIFLPPDAEESERAQCREAAEEVISTFVRLP